MSTCAVKRRIQRLAIAGEKIAPSCAILISLLFVPVALAQQSPKIGIVNVQQALVTTQEGKKAVADLNAKIQPKQKEFEARRQEVSQLEGQFARASLLSEDKKAALSREIDDKKKRLDRDTQDAEEDLRNQQQQMLQSISQKLLAAIGRYGKENNFTVILASGDPNAQVLYAASESDITAAIVNAYDKAYSGSPQTHP
jgi:outer membrane protein